MALYNVQVEEGKVISIRGGRVVSLRLLSQSPTGLEPQLEKSKKLKLKKLKTKRTQVKKTQVQETQMLQVESNLLVLPTPTSLPLVLNHTWKSHI